ncbi:hypothetical protein ACWEQL_17825 [Kitasatospora sp. NPDC004240]
MDERSAGSRAEANFHEKTKLVLAQRAAYRCSNPGCGKLTIGPGSGAEDTSSTGTASHIYAAAEGGPRGTGGLSPEQRRHASNGIWLCASCGGLVDTNEGRRYPVSLLRGWRDLHETRTRLEHSGVAGPGGWINSVEVREDVWLAEPTTVRFSRCNMFIGPNASGKTLFMTLLSGLSEPSQIMRRAALPDSAVNAVINWYDPQPRTAEISADERGISFVLDGAGVPFVAQPYRVLKPSLPLLGHPAGSLTSLASRLGLDPWNARGLLLRTPEIVGGAVKEVAIEGKDGIRAVCSLDGKEFCVRGSEQERLPAIVVLEVAIALAEESARAQPTLLLLDEDLDMMHPRGFRHCRELLSSASRNFQTVAVSHQLGALQDPEWTVTRFEPLDAQEFGASGSLPVRLVQDEDPLETYAALGRRFTPFPEAAGPR